MKFAYILPILITLTFIKQAKSYQALKVNGEVFNYLKDENGIRFSPSIVLFKLKRDQDLESPLCLEFNKSMEKELIIYQNFCQPDNFIFEKSSCVSRKKYIGSQRLGRLASAYFEGNYDVKQRWTINTIANNYTDVILELSKMHSVAKELIIPAAFELTVELLLKHIQYSKESWIEQMLKLYLDPPVITKYNNSVIQTLGRDIGCDIVNQQVSFQFSSESVSEIIISKSVLSETEVLALSERLKEQFLTGAQKKSMSVVMLANLANEITLSLSTVPNLTEAMMEIESEKIVDLFFKNEKSNLFLNYYGSKEVLKAIKYSEIKQDQFPIDVIYQGADI